MGYGKVVRVITGASGTKKGAEVTLQLSDGSSAPSSPNTGTDTGTGTDYIYAPPATGGGGDQSPSQPEPLFNQEDVDRLTNDVRDFFGL